MIIRNVKDKFEAGRMFANSMNRPIDKWKNGRFCLAGSPNWYIVKQHITGYFLLEMWN